jgi:exodeoxyribonuclease VII large subunit
VENKNMANRFVFTISELTRHIRETLESAYPDVWVEGEISNLRVPSSGHCYFTLKDEGAQLRAVMFRMQARLLRFVPEDGLKVICRGRINVYEQRGEYQLIAEMLEPKGVGDLQLAFEQLKQKLQQEGLFDEGRKKPLPFLPSRVAVITSATGAAVRDIIRVMHRRFPNVAILVVPVKVQGDEAPHEIALAVATVNRHNLADVIIVGRGGGSLEDLWAFNTETVARSIAASAIPVVSAVGHEVDVTIADCVADLRAPTPSAAAELVMREKRELVQLVAQYELRLREGWGKQRERILSRIEHACSRLRHPTRRIADLRLRLDDLQCRMATAVPRLITRRRLAITSACRIIAAQSPTGRIAANRLKTSFFEQRVAAGMAAVVQRKSSALRTLVAQLSAFNPAAILARGYSMTRLLPSLQIVRSSDEVAPGAAVQLTLGKGVVDCIVEKIVK